MTGEWVAEKTIANPASALGILLTILSIMVSAPPTKRLLNQPDAGIVEYPQAKVFIGSDDVNLVHDFL